MTYNGFKALLPTACSRAEESEIQVDEIFNAVRRDVPILAMNLSIKLRIVHSIHHSIQECGFHQQWQ